MEKSRELDPRGDFLMIPSFCDSWLTASHHSPAVAAEVSGSGTWRDEWCEKPGLLQVQVLWGGFLQPVFRALGILSGWSQFINRLLIIYGQMFADPQEFPFRQHSKHPK